jgi:ABC-type sugar transport system permease subunit
VKPRILLGLAPLTLYLAAFTLVPVASTFVLSLSAPGDGITLEHFRRIAGHYQFGQAVVNTLGITVIGPSLELGLGLLAALALTSRPVGRKVFQVLLLVPLGVPTIVAASVMRTVFGTVGYLNEILLRLGIIRTPVDWVGARGLALAGRGLPVLSTYAYVEYLEYGNPHTAAASSVILLAMILIAVGTYLKLAGPEEVLR